MIFNFFKKQNCILSLLLLVSIVPCKGQETLKGLYIKMFDQIKNGSAKNCDAGFAIFGNYFYGKRMGKSYKDFIDKLRIHPTRGSIEGLSEIQELEDYPLLFLSTYVQFELSSNDDFKKATERQNAEKLKSVEKVANVIYHILTQEQIKPNSFDSKSSALFNKIITYAKKCDVCVEECLKGRMRILANYVIGQVQQAVAEAKQKLESEKKTIDSLTNVYIEEKNKLKKIEENLAALRLEDYQIRNGRSPRDTCIFCLPTAKEKEEINVENFETGKDCYEELKISAKNYAKGRIAMLDKIMQERDAWVDGYNKIKNAFETYKNYCGFDNNISLKEIDGTIKNKLEIKLEILGKADGLSSCSDTSFTNYGICPHFATYEGEGILNINFSYFLSENGEEHQKKIAFSKGTKLNNITLAILRAVCVGNEIENFFKTQSLSNSRYLDRYSIKIKYSARQYMGAPSSKNRGFIVSTFFRNTNKSIEDYLIDISSNMQSLNSLISCLASKSQELQDVLDILK